MDNTTLPTWLLITLTLAPTIVIGAVSVYRDRSTSRSTLDRDAALWRRDKFTLAAEGFLVECRRAVEAFDEALKPDAETLDTEPLRRALQDAYMWVWIHADEETLRASVWVRDSFNWAALTGASAHVESFRESTNNFARAMRKQLVLPEIELSRQDDPARWADRQVGGM